MSKQRDNRVPGGGYQPSRPNADELLDWSPPSEYNFTAFTSEPWAHLVHILALRLAAVEERITALEGWMEAKA